MQIWACGLVAPCLIAGLRTRLAGFGKPDGPAPCMLPLLAAGELNAGPWLRCRQHGQPWSKCKWKGIGHGAWGIRRGPGVHAASDWPVRGGRWPLAPGRGTSRSQRHSRNHTCATCIQPAIGSIVIALVHHTSFHVAQTCPTRFTPFILKPYIRKGTLFKPKVCAGRHVCHDAAFL